MARRIAGSTVDWAAVAKAGEKFEKNTFIAFKAKTDKQLKRLIGKPTELPKIDWSYYKAKIAAPGLVDSFQKSYESLNVPYPSDQGYIAKLESQEKEDLQKYRNGIKSMQNEIAKMQQQLEKLNAEIPYSEMTMEEFFLARPDAAFSPEKPSLWPHYSPADRAKK